MTKINALGTIQQDRYKAVLVFLSQRGSTHRVDKDLPNGSTLWPLVTGTCAIGQQRQ